MRRGTGEGGPNRLLVVYVAGRVRSVPLPGSRSCRGERLPGPPGRAGGAWPGDRLVDDRGTAPGDVVDRSLSRTSPGAGPPPSSRGDAIRLTGAQALPGAGGERSRRGDGLVPVTVWQSKLPGRAARPARRRTPGFSEVIGGAGAAWSISTTRCGGGPPSGLQPGDGEPGHLRGRLPRCLLTTEGLAWGAL